MSRLSLSRLTSAAVLGLVLSTVTAVGASAAPAPTDGAPVTADDTVRVVAGEANQADVLRNDTDPDGNSLAVCRLGRSSYSHVFAQIEPGYHAKGIDIADSVVVYADAKAKPRAYYFTYYACDYSVLTPGTLTVNVKKAPVAKPLVVRKVKGTLGKLRVFNPNKAKALLLWGDFSSQQDGQLTVRPHTSKVFTVHRHTVDWVGLILRTGVMAGIGHVHHINLPKGDKLPPPYDGGVSGGSTTVSDTPTPVTTPTPAARAWAEAR